MGWMLKVFGNNNTLSKHIHTAHSHSDIATSNSRNYFVFAKIDFNTTKALQHAPIHIYTNKGAERLRDKQIYIHLISYINKATHCVFVHYK